MLKLVFRSFMGAERILFSLSASRLAFAWTELLSRRFVHITDDSKIICSLSESARLKQKGMDSGQRVCLSITRSLPRWLVGRLQPGYASRALIWRLNGAGGVLGVGHRLPLARHSAEGKHELRLPGDRREEGQRRGDERKRGEEERR